MHNTETIIHVIQPGEYPYQLARRYHTTVAEILALNPNVDPQNLVIGSHLIIPVGTNQNETSNQINSQEKVNLSNEMRLALEQHIYWTRMLLLSTVARSDDQNAVMERLLRNPDDIARIYSNYYPETTVNAIANLLTTHLQIESDIMIALRDNNTTEVNHLTSLWHQNADQIARLLSESNPHYNYQQLRGIFNSYLNLTIQEIKAHIAKEYTQDIAAFDALEAEAMHIADILSMGIVKQFPNRF